MEGAAVGARVVEGDIVDEDGSDLNVVGPRRPMPLQAVRKVLVEDVGVGVVVVKDLTGAEKTHTGLRCSLVVRFLPLQVFVGLFCVLGTYESCWVCVQGTTKTCTSLSDLTKM